MSEEWKALADSILDTIKGRAKKFLDDNQEAKDILTERTKALAKLAWQYKRESDEAKRAEILTEMGIVKQTIENEISALALVGKAESISAFKEVVGTALGAVVKYIPIILSMV